MQENKSGSIVYLHLGIKAEKQYINGKKKYLSEETIEKVKLIDKEADEIISEGKIEDVIFYFDKLDDIEKSECIQKLQDRLS